MASIRTRVSAALGVVLVLYVITAVMGHVGLDKAQADFETYEETNADTLRVLEIDRTITELQRTVTTFILTGHESSADRVRELKQLANDQILEAISETTDDEIAARLRDMSARIQVYGENFEKVAIDR
ncbi:MAG: hypothetical protein AAGA55_11610, partial [Planctomycetota bacterium]